MSVEVIKENINALCRLLKDDLPPVRNAAGSCMDQLVSMRDGKRLMTRVLLPEGKGPWPVILVRNPYNKVNDDNAMGHPLFAFVNYGYALVYQQIRGLYDSEGDWYAFENEREDGLDTVEWIKEQPWCAGKIGTYGSSYLAHVQWCMADALPAEVKAMYLSDFGGEPYELFYENGMFKLGIWNLWAAQMMSPEGKEEVGQPDVDAFFESLKVKPPIDMDIRIKGKYCEYYRNWVTSPSPDSLYWKRGFWGRYGEIVNSVRTPVLFQAGWFDIFLESELRTFFHLPDSIRKKSRLIIGPWHHGNQCGGDLSYKKEGAMGTLQMKAALEWFDHYLMDMPYPRKLGAVEAYKIGADEWCLWDKEQTKEQELFLDINPAGATKNSTGALQLYPPRNAEMFGYLYDPDHPVSFKGGNWLLNFEDPGKSPACSCRQEMPCRRQDVLTFLSEPLKQAICIKGRPSFSFYVCTDVPNTAFTVRLSEQTADNTAYNIRDGAADLLCCGSRMDNGDYHLKFTASEVYWELKAGSRIRLDISSSNYPGYHLHPNLPGTWSVQAAACPANQTVYSGGDRASSIVLPIACPCAGTDQG